jgi:hypothetical protein
MTELEQLEKKFAELEAKDAAEPGKHALELNALGEEIALLRREQNGDPS